jgi:hypothetical protein
MRWRVLVPESTQSHAYAMRDLVHEFWVDQRILQPLRMRAPLVDVRASVVDKVVGPFSLASRRMDDSQSKRILLNRRRTGSGRRRSTRLRGTRSPETASLRHAIVGGSARARYRPRRHGSDDRPRERPADRVPVRVLLNGFESASGAGVDPSASRSVVRIPADAGIAPSDGKRSTARGRQG